MRVLIAVHGFPPTRSAGAERRAERMADWLAANGHDVEVFAIERVDQPDFRVERTRHGRQESYPVHRASFDVEAGAGFFRNSYDYPPIARALDDLLRHGRFDLVHLVCGYLLAAQAVGAARAHGVPVVFTLTEFWPMCPRLNLVTALGEMCSGPDSPDKCVRCLAEDRRRFRFPARVAPPLANLYWSVARTTASAVPARAEMARRQAALREAVTGADRVVCPSRFLLRKYEEYGFDTGRFVFMRQGLSGVPSERRAAGAPGEQGLKLAYVGQIKPHKGVDLVVEAVREIARTGRRVTLDIWGPEAEAPGYVAQLKRRSAGLPAIAWNGQCAGSQMWAALARADALVVPSGGTRTVRTPSSRHTPQGFPSSRRISAGWPNWSSTGRAGCCFTTMTPRACVGRLSGWRTSRACSSVCRRACRP